MCCREWPTGRCPSRRTDADGVEVPSASLIYARADRNHGVGRTLTIDQLMRDKYEGLVDSDEIPTFREVRKAAGEALDFVNDTISARGGRLPGELIADTRTPLTEPVGPIRVSPGGGSAIPQSREEALRTILAIVKWLESHEPQNLYTGRIREAIEDADCSVQDVLAKFIENESERQAVTKRLGHMLNWGRTVAAPEALHSRP